MELTKEEWENALRNAKKEAEAGNVEAMKATAIIIRGGSTLDEDNLEGAFPYYKMAADHGDIECAEVVASAYYAQIESMKDDVLALKYFKQAADGGSLKGQRYTGVFYANGIGCKPDITLAKKYLEMAALRNDGYAQWELFELIMSTRTGKDEKQDIKIAASASHWANCAYVNGVEEAIALAKSSGLEETMAFQTSVEEIKRNGPAPSTNQGEKNYDSNSSNSNITAQENNYNTENSTDAHCYVATAVYGSYDCSEVWALRRYRDNVLSSSYFGRAFIRIYYFISPTIVKWFGNMNWFQRIWRRRLDKMVQSLRENGIEDTPYEDKNWNRRARR